MRRAPLSLVACLAVGACAPEPGQDLTLEPAVLDFGVVDLGAFTSGVPESDRIALVNGSERWLWVHTVTLADTGNGAFAGDASVTEWEPVELAPGDGGVELTVGVYGGAPPGDFEGLLRVEYTSRCASAESGDACGDESEQVAEAALRVTTTR